MKGVPVVKTGTNSAPKFKYSDELKTIEKIICLGPLLIIDR